MSRPRLKLVFFKTEILMMWALPSCLASLKKMTKEMTVTKSPPQTSGLAKPELKLLTARVKIKLNRQLRAARQIPP